MKDKLNGVDMDAAIKYMVKHDCRLDEAIAAVSDSVSDRKATDPVKPSKIVSDRKRAVEKTSATEKPISKLKAARMKAGLSQSELAEKADIKLRTLQSYEQGYKSFDSARLETILKVALACAARLEDLIESPALLEIIKKYNEV